ncbi:hypothetical protein FACS1894202_02420 [Clostridia bacterium]|nr:hypothetical protein FACS1894202_02420 [Clostridia bacterium]
MELKITIGRGGKIVLPEAALKAMGVTERGVLRCEVSGKTVILSNAEKAPLCMAEHLSACSPA